MTGLTELLPKTLVLIFLLAMASHARASDSRAWVERLAFWVAPELRSLQQKISAIDHSLAGLPVATGVNTGNRMGFQSAGTLDGQDLWVELEFPVPVPADSVVLVPLLAKGSRGEVPGFGFPRRFVLEGFDAENEPFLLMDETSSPYALPGIFPVRADCPAATTLRRVRLTAIEPWQNEGPPVLALSEIMVIHGNRNLSSKAKVRSSSSREIPPSWSRNNLVDMITPLGLPILPSDSKTMGWHGPVASKMQEVQWVTVDLATPVRVDEIRLIPAWRSSMAWDSYYGFPARFKIETSLEQDFASAEMIYDRTETSLLSPGQNLQCFPTGGKWVRYIRVTATRLRDRTGDFVFALGELQAYSGNENVALGAAVSAPELSGDAEWSRAGLTDGDSRGGRLIELPQWIRQLEQRRQLEIERGELALRRSEVFTRAEHTLVTASVGSASGVALLAGLFSWRGHRQRVLDRERHRERLARDLHDELGSNLGSIALISSFAAQEEAAQMRLDLAEIERVARESADSMRDMVSLLGGKRGGVAADWLNVMNGLAERLMRGVELECMLPAAPLIWEPNLETRRELYLFCKEVLHNAARHGKPRALKFHLSPTADGLRIEIHDDGCGFDISHVQSGHGLGNLRERASMMRATMTLRSSPGAGTHLTLEVPRGRRWTKR